MANSDIQHHKAAIWACWEALSARPGEMEAIVRSSVHEHIAWSGPHPINQLHGVDALLDGFWRPLLHAFPDLRRQSDVFLGGEFEDNQWVCATGYFTGTFCHEWLGIPATGAPARIRFGDFCRVTDGSIREEYLLLDLVDVMLQAGYRVLPPSRGDERPVPGPSTANGVLLEPEDEQATQHSLRLVEAMLAGLRNYDGADLRSMNMATFWHPEMCWYGPCGIGTARGLGNYEQVHAQPFLHAFPDRVGGHHKARLAEGAYVASTGWPSVYATHRGEWLGAPATGKRIGMRVMDFWRRDDELLAENWVFIDLVDLFKQFGIDLFERLNTARSNQGTTRGNR